MLKKKVKNRQSGKNLLLIRFIFSLTVILNTSHSLLSAQEQVCIVETREYPGRDPAMWDGLYAASDGKVYSALIHEGISAHFYLYDPTTEKNILLCDMADF